MARLRAAALIAAVNKARDYARNNPEKTSEMIGKVEGFARTKAGPKHTGTVGKGADALRRGLGVDGRGSGASGASGGGQVPPPPPPGAAS